jgi:hypothetical protein
MPEMNRPRGKLCWLLAAIGVAILACDCGAKPGGGSSPPPAVEIEPFGSCAEDGTGTVPQTLDEALDELQRILDPAHTEDFKTRKPIEYHHGLGTSLRNCWGLWSGGSGLASWFAEQGITHPDDMSSIVLTSFHRRLNGKEIDLPGQIAGHKAYWEKQKEAYEDGSSSGNSLFNLVEFQQGAGWVSLSGDNIPHVGDLVTPLIEHSRAPVTACWKRFPKTPGNSAVDTEIAISIDEQGSLTTAAVTDTAIPEADAECMAQALVGAAVPEHKGATYELIFQTYRFVEPD